MYEIPSRTDVKRCLINGSTILRRTAPILLTRTDRPVEMDEVKDESA